MKAIILANLGKEHFFDNKLIPTCFLPLYNNMTVIERQISLLNVNGFSNEDIFVLLGQGGLWDNVNVKKHTDKVKTGKAFITTNGHLFTYLFIVDMLLSDFFADEDVLIIEGNLVFDLAILSRLRRYRQKNVLVVRDMIHPGDTEHSIILNNHRIVAINGPAAMAYPWVSFAGIARLSADLIKTLQTVTSSPLTIIEKANELISEHEIMAIDYNDLLFGKMDGGHSNELIGGSYAKLNYRLVVKKDAEGDGRQKLINEINWLLGLPSELKPYFSEVLSYDIESDKVYFDVPYYGSRNLREYIFMGCFDADATIMFLDHLLMWMFKNVYAKKINAVPVNWVMDKQIKRVLDRLPECAAKSKTLAKFINADKIMINGVEYKNIEELFTNIANNVDFIKRVSPSDMVMIHGDLHFQNILLYNETDTGFILVDPRGELLGSDIYYDMGKLWHSFHGKYDFIHSDQFKLNVTWNEDVPSATFGITNTYVEKVYDEIYEKFLQLIPKFIGNDPDWEMKALFAEAAHFCSVMTFHINKTGNHDRAVSLYLIGVRLINEFYDKYLL